MVKGQAQAGQVLILLLIFMASAIFITTAATATTLINTRSSSDYSLSQDALHIAEAGLDNAILRYTRDRSYSGETITIGPGTATITVSGTGTVTITSNGTVGVFTRRVQAVLAVANNNVSLTSWQEIP